MSCYVCQSTLFVERKGRVRDLPDIKVLECSECGLVYLSDTDHIQPGFYENSGMHEGGGRSIENWLKDTDWDDQRRYEMLKSILPNKKVLDFGCGAGGFLLKVQPFVSEIAGVELELRVHDYWSSRIPLYEDIAAVKGKYDLVTAFHVLEHVLDPRAVLQELSAKLAPGGRLIVEIPNSEDALLTLFDCAPFQNFTYWSQHLYLFNTNSLQRLAEQAGLRPISVQQYQRYPLSNHLHWLSKGRPGGHRAWGFLDGVVLGEAYTNSLAALGKCDTLIAHLEKNPE